MWARYGRWNLAWNARLPRSIQESFTYRKSTTWDRGLYFPSEGVLRIFSPWKIRRLRPGLNPRTWVPKASTLPLDHRRRLISPSLWACRMLKQRIAQKNRKWLKCKGYYDACPTVLCSDYNVGLITWTLQSEEVEPRRAKWKLWLWVSTCLNDSVVNP